MDTELELTPTNLKEILICADSCQDGVLSGRLVAAPTEFTTPILFFLP